MVRNSQAEIFAVLKDGFMCVCVYLCVGISMLYVHPTDEEMYDTTSSRSSSYNVDVIPRACANGHHLALVSTSEVDSSFRA